MAKLFCVYEHWTPCGRLFYVGKGNAIRPYQSQNRNKHWHRVVAKYGLIVKIVGQWEGETMALLHEEFLIALYRSNGEKLTNILSGGVSNSGPRHTPESKERLRIAHTGKKRSRESVEKQRSKVLGIPKSKEHREKLSKAKTGKSVPSVWKKVMCINTGEIFESVSSASNKLGVDKSHIVKCCRGKLKHISGFKFVYSK